MQDFHKLVKGLLACWIILYALMILPSLGLGLILYVMSDFSMPVKHALDIINTIHMGALWLVPTCFLWLAYYLSRPKSRVLGRVNN